MVSTTRVRAARYWAVLLVVLALAACTTGLARPATAASMTTMPGMIGMAGAATGMPAPAADSLHGMAPAAGGQARPAPVAEAACPMAGMDCALSAHHQRIQLPTAHQAPGDGSPCVSTAPPVWSAALGGVPPPGSARRGPDLHRLCVSRT